MLMTPAIANETTMAGPAWFLASTPVRVKMPVPMTIPMPNPIRSRAVRFLDSLSPPPSTSSFW